MKTIYHYTVPSATTIEEMWALVDKFWTKAHMVPGPCEIIRIADGDNLVIENMPEHEDLDESIKLISDALNNPEHHVALITREGMSLQRCGAHHE